MSRPASYRDKLKRMQNHVSCLQSRANQLQREQDSAQLQLDVWEGLLAVRDAWSAVIAAVLPAPPGQQLPQQTGASSSGRQQEQLQPEQQQQDTSPCGSDAALDPDDPLALLSLPAASSNRAAGDTGVSDHIAQQLPLLPALSQVDRAMHAAVMQLDADAAAQQWVQYLSETMQLLVLAELEPTTAEPLLQTHMQRTLAWLLCLYYFNTSVAFALHNVNLLTRATEPTPANHWQQAFKAAAMTTQQLQQIEFANQFCVPRLQQLQAQQQQLQEELAELSQSAGPGSGSGSGRQGQESPTAAAATATSPAPALNRTAAAPAGAAGMAAAVSMASQAVARLDVPMAPAGSDGPSGSTGSGGSLGGCSSRARQQLLAQAKQLEQRISSNFKAWMVLANMRAHYCSAVLTPVQMARLVTAAAPYLLIGAPIYDEVAATKPNAPPPIKRRG